MWRAFLVGACAVALASANAENIAEARVVRTYQGPVRGYKDPNTNVFEFHGIPYATAPQGIYKFMAPTPAPAWFDVFEAVNKGIVCPQQKDNVMFTEGLQMDENCLVANIYVPDTTENKLSVLVYVHGGAFQMGYGDAFTPKQLIKDKKIIAVTFNYRLGVHGFLCLGTENAPGNAGLKDQVALLRWVHKNIAIFGGNPEDVTIAGYSAGSASVDLLLLSPSTRGLFNKAILESGSNLATWTIQTDPLEGAKAHARILDFPHYDDTYSLEKFYTTSSLELLMSRVNITEPDSTLGFVPCVEHSSGEGSFLSDTPLNILKSGQFRKIPLLNGLTNMEGLVRMTVFGTWKDRMNKKFSDFLPADLKFQNEDQKEEVARKVKEFYFGNQAVDENTMSAYVDYFTDIIFAYGSLRSLKLQQSFGNNKIYLYEYSFVADGETPTGYKNYTLPGAHHCAQTKTVLDVASYTKTLGANEDSKGHEITFSLREMWSNFVTTESPVAEGSTLPAWPPMGANWSPHMSLGNTIELRDSLLLERMLFWEDIYEKYYRAPVPPPIPPPKHSEL